MEAVFFFGRLGTSPGNTRGVERIKNAECEGSRVYRSRRVLPLSESSLSEESLLSEDEDCVFIFVTAASKDFSASTEFSSRK